MAFRRNTCSYWSVQALCLVCMAGAAWVMIKVYPFSAASMLLAGICGIMLVLMLFNPWNQMLYIDARGIRCCRRGQMLWSLTWEEVKEIRPAAVNRFRGYVIIPKDVPKQDLQKPEAATDFTFEHSRKIKAALERYAQYHR